MKKNDLLTLTITDMNDLGCGVGHAEGKAVFVKNTVTGEIWETKIIKDAGRYFVAIPLRRLSSSGRRSSACCASFPQCGGCAFSHVVYPYEKELKQGFVRSYLRKERLGEVEVLPVKSTGKIAGYRNKVQFPCQNGAVGYFAAHSHRIVTDTRCALHLPEMQELLDALAAFVDNEHVSCYDEVCRTGLLRHICLRANADGSAMLLTLVLNGRTFPKEQALFALLDRFPAVRGVFYNVNEQNTNVILGEEYIHARGDEVLVDTLLGCSFELSPASFYQVNHDACELLYKEVIARAGDCTDKTVADLFCGVGTIGICLAKHAPVGRLIGVEIVPQAVENAKRNAARNGVQNAEFYCGDANHPALERADVVIVDPPRKGLDEELIAHLTALPALKKIVYASCAPDTLARDLRRFRDRGWTLGEVQPVDMFPRTGHIECVISISRQ